MREQTLHERGSMRGIIRPSVRREEKCRDSCISRVVFRRDEELEEVEEAQCRDEEWGAPEGCWVDGHQEESRACGEAQSDAEEKCAQRDSRQGHFTGWVVEGVYGVFNLRRGAGLGGRAGEGIAGVCVMRRPPARSGGLGGVEALDWKGGIVGCGLGARDGCGGGHCDDGVGLS